MSAGAESVIRQRLAADERLIWAGRPRCRARLRLGDVHLVVGCLVGVGLVLLPLTDPHLRALPAFAVAMTIWVVMTSLILTLHVGSRVLYEVRLRHLTWYGVTDRRVIIITGGWGRVIKSLPFLTLSQVMLTERWFGAGDITFGRPPPWWEAHRWTWTRIPTPPSFEDIDGVRTVYETIMAQVRTCALEAVPAGEGRPRVKDGRSDEDQHVFAQEGLYRKAPRV